MIETKARMQSKMMTAGVLGTHATKTSATLPVLECILTTSPDRNPGPVLMPSHEDEPIADTNGHQDIHRAERRTTKAKSQQPSRRGNQFSAACLPVICRYRHTQVRCMYRYFTGISLVKSIYRRLAYKTGGQAVCYNYSHRTRAGCLPRETEPIPNEAEMTPEGWCGYRYQPHCDDQILPVRGISPDRATRAPGIRTYT